MRRFVELLASDRPHVIVMDDLQWAEQSLLDLLEQIAEWVRGLPVLLLSMARPDLLDTRPGWGGGKPDATTFVLEPLPAAETEELTEALFKGGHIEPAARARIATAAEGNPLFVEQLVEMLIDERVVERSDDGTLVLSQLGSIDVPPTIQALLAARLDRLSEPERRTIERAAVVGKEFGQREVSELTPAEGRSSVSTQLLALVRKELIRPERRRDDGAETYRFRHLLIRDAAYDSLPKGERAELHEHFAGLAGGNGRRSIGGARRDRRLSPRAGTGIPAGARARRFEDARARAPGRSPARRRGAASSGTRRDRDGHGPVPSSRGAPRRRPAAPVRVADDGAPDRPPGRSRPIVPGGSRSGGGRDRRAGRGGNPPSSTHGLDGARLG
jgi:DNA-binding transcriptional ArsR family regulator